MCDCANISVGKLELKEDDVLVVQISGNLPQHRFAELATSFKKSFASILPFEIGIIVVGSEVSFLKISGEDAMVLKLNGDGN